MIKAAVRPIAAASAKRLKEYPELPTIAEIGYPRSDVSHLVPARRAGENAACPRSSSASTTSCSGC